MTNVTGVPFERFALMQRDVESHAKTLSVHTTALHDLQRESAVRSEREKSLDDRLGRIEESIKAIHKLGWWALTAFGSSFVALLANFLFRGGFS